MTGVAFRNAWKFDAKTHIPLERGTLFRRYFLTSVRYVRFSARVRDCFARSIAVVSIGESRAFRELFRSELHACGRRVKC